MQRHPLVTQLCGLLRYYMLERPQHDAGLCCWLEDESRGEVSAYEAIAAVFTHHPEWLIAGHYVDVKSGCTPRRRRFARFLLGLIRNHDLRYDSRDGWTCREPKQPSPDRGLVTFQGVIDARCREAKQPTVARLIIGNNVYYVVIGTDYGYLRNTSGDPRTWRSYSAARRAAKRYVPL